jgi:hypothetical protein
LFEQACDAPLPPVFRFTLAEVLQELSVTLVILFGLLQGVSINGRHRREMKTAQQPGQWIMRHGWPPLAATHHRCSDRRSVLCLDVSRDAFFMRLILLGSRPKNATLCLGVSVVKNKESKDPKNKSSFAASFAVIFQISLARIFPPNPTAADEGRAEKEL